MDKKFLNKVYCAAKYNEWEFVGGTEFKTKVLNTISSIADERVKFVMFYRYYQGYKFKVIADKMGITYQYVWKLHKKGVQIVDKLWK